MKHLIALLVLASLAIVGCADSTSQEPVSALSNETSLSLSKGTPFKMTLVEVGAPPPAFVQCTGLPGFTPVGSTGTGHSTALGPFEIIQGHCSDFATGESRNGFAECTFPNGDKLFGTYTSQLVFPGSFPNFDFVGHAFFIGGTGRFTNTRGEGIATGTLNVLTGAVTLTIEGTLVHR